MEFAEQVKAPRYLFKVKEFRFGCGTDVGIQMRGPFGHLSGSILPVDLCAIPAGLCSESVFETFLCSGSVSCVDDGRVPEFDGAEAGTFQDLLLAEAAVSFQRILALSTRMKM